jgi:hypothetical protein
MNRLQALRAELANNEAELQQHQAALDAERRKPEPRRDELVRLRGLCAECQRVMDSVRDDLAFEQDIQASAASVAARAAARARRGLALDSAASTQALQAIERGLQEAIEGAKSFSVTANDRAGHAATTAWAHHEGDQMAASQAAGVAAGTVLGTEYHAFALALLVRDFLDALPVPLRNRITQGYLTPNQISYAGRTPVTLAQAAAHAEGDLQQRLGAMLAEPVEALKAAA